MAFNEIKAIYPENVINLVKKIALIVNSNIKHHTFLIITK
jgi:hypothetical protein